MVNFWNSFFLILHMICISNVEQNIRALQSIGDQQDYIYGIDGRSSLTSNDEEIYGLKDSLEDINKNIFVLKESNADLSEDIKMSVDDEETFLVDYKNVEEIESEDNYGLYDLKTIKTAVNTREDINNKNADVMGNTGGIRKDNGDNGKNKAKGVKKFIVKTNFEKIEKVSDELFEQLNKLFSFGNIRNVSNTGININGKKYFNMVKICLEMILENDEKLSEFLNECSTSNTSKNPEIGNLPVDKEYEKLFFKTCFIFVYRKLFSNTKRMLQKIQQIKLNKDCGCLYIHDVHKYFYKTFIINLIGKNYNVGFLLTNFKSSFDPFKDVYRKEERLVEFQKHFIDVPFANFGISYKYTDILAIDYIFTVFYYSVTNLKPFIFTLPRLSKEKSNN